MRVAIISPPFVPVPPMTYGGTEQVVWELARGLRDLGHAITLFATGDSVLPGVEIRWQRPTAEWPPCPYREVEQAAWAVEEIGRARARYDLVHSHLPTVLPLARFIDAPLVYTVHHAFDASLSALYTRCVAK